MTFFETSGHEHEMVVGGIIFADDFGRTVDEQGTSVEYLRPLEEQSLVELASPDLAVAARGVSRIMSRRHSV